MTKSLRRINLLFTNKNNNFSNFIDISRQERELSRSKSPIKEQDLPKVCSRNCIAQYMSDQKLENFQDEEYEGESYQIMPPQRSLLQNFETKVAKNRNKSVMISDIYYILYSQKWKESKRNFKRDQNLPVIITIV